MTNQLNISVVDDNSSSTLTLEQRQDLELKLQTSRTRQLFIKIEIIDTDNQVVSEVSGSAISGSYDIDSSSAIRRTCSISFNLESGYLPKDNTSIFWINKRFKLFIGLKRFDTNTVYWFNKGTYAIKDPSVSISISDKTITINGLDKMALHTGDISGQLAYETIIEVDSGVYAHEAVNAIMLDGGETNLLIENTDLQIPYKIESNIGDVRWDIISELVNLFYNYQAYYNLDGYFVFGKKPMYQSSGNIVNTIAMNFSETYENDELQTIPHDLIISINRDIEYSNIKNKIVVYGGVHDDGYQSYYKIIVDEVSYPDSPYSIEKLNEKNSDGTLICRNIVVQDDSYIDDGSEESTVNEVLIPKNNYQFEMAKKGNKTIVEFSQIKLPSYYEVDIPNVNNAWGIANKEQSVHYKVIWDGKSYTLTPYNYYGDTYYIGNVYILEQILESGDYSKADDTGQPFVCWYNGKSFGIYTNDSISEEHNVQLIRREKTNHAYSIELCKKRAEQELYLHQQATDKVTIVCLPIYSLDVNEVIYLDDSSSGAVGEYAITKISCGLGAGDTMTITANKLW